MEDRDINEFRALLIQMRKYFIQHGLPTGECVAWNKLKGMFGIAGTESEWQENLNWLEEYERKQGAVSAT